MTLSKLLQMKKLKVFNGQKAPVFDTKQPAPFPSPVATSEVSNPARITLVLGAALDTTNQAEHLSRQI